MYNCDEVSRIITKSPMSFLCVTWTTSHMGLRVPPSVSFLWHQRFPLLAERATPASLGSQVPTCDGKTPSPAARYQAMCCPRARGLWLVLEEGTGSCKAQNTLTAFQQCWGHGSQGYQKDEGTWPLASKSPSTACFLSHSVWLRSRPRPVYHRHLSKGGDLPDNNRSTEWCLYFV